MLVRCKKRGWVVTGRWLCIALVAGGCGSREEEGSVCSCGPALIQYTPMYSAFGGSHSYAVAPYVPAADPRSRDTDPILASTIEWYVDEQFVSQKAFPEIPGATKLTTRRAGTTRVSVAAKSASGATIQQTSMLTISKADDDAWAMGDARYSGGPHADLRNTLRGLEELSADAGAAGCDVPVQLHDELPKAAACTSCHAESGDDNSPVLTAGYSNDQLIAILTQGMKPAGYPFNSDTLRALPRPDCIFAQLHDWLIDEDVKFGLILKLRSFPLSVPPR